MSDDKDSNKDLIEKHKKKEELKEKEGVARAFEEIEKHSSTKTESFFDDKEEPTADTIEKEKKKPVETPRQSTYSQPARVGNMNMEHEGPLVEADDIRQLVNDLMEERDWDLDKILSSIGDAIEEMDFEREIKRVSKGDIKADSSTDHILTEIKESIDKVAESQEKMAESGGMMGMMGGGEEGSTPEIKMPDEVTFQVSDDMSQEEERPESEIESGTIRKDEMSDEEKVPDVFEVPDEYKYELEEGFKEVERYWIEPPYAMAVISYNEETSDYKYHLIEPELTEREEMLYEEIEDKVKTDIISSRDIKIKKEDMKEKAITLRKRMREVINRMDVDISQESFEKIYYYEKINQIEYGRLTPLTKDKSIEDISCNGAGKNIFIYHRDYRDLETDIVFGERELDQYVVRLAQMANKQITKSDPVQEGSLPDGSRFHLTLGKEITPHGSSVTIRRFQDVPFTPVDLVRTNTFNSTQMAYLWMAIQKDSSLIFAGGTASGKTTSMNAVSLFIPPTEKTVSIEDTREVQLPKHKNWIPTETRESFTRVEGGGSNNINMYDLLRGALRQRPEYIIVGEIRGEEATTLFQAMSTGHTTYSTMHAEDPEQALRRLTNEPINVAPNLVNHLDIMSIQAQENRETEQGVDRVRRNKVIKEIGWVDDSGNSPKFRDSNNVFKWRSGSDTFEENLESSLVLDKIRRNQYGATGGEQEIMKELEDRKRVIDYLVDSDIKNVHVVTDVIHTYMKNKNKIINKIENDTLREEAEEQNLR